ncbi:MAG: sulfur carrier protein ThiS [Gammaproteobacteria bacterium]
MQVFINGKQTELPSGTSVQNLIEQFDIRDKVAVEINEEIVSRSRFELHTLEDGDRVEIVRAIGGG